MIETNEYEFPAGDYFRMMFRHQLKIYFWAWSYLSVFLCSLAIFSGEWCFSVSSISAVAIFFLAAAYFRARNFAYSTENRSALQKRTMRFDENMYHLVGEDGTEARGPLEHIHRADIACGYYRLYINKINYYVIPWTAFRSEEDRGRFENEILGDKLKRKSIPWKRMILFLLISTILLGLSICARDTERIEDFESDRIHGSDRNDH